jgi:hypothetical protein
VSRRARNHGPREPRSNAYGLAATACAIAVGAIVALSGTGLAQQGGVGVSPGHVDLGEVGPGSQATDSLTIESDRATSTVFDIAVSGAQASWFSVSASGDGSSRQNVLSSVQLEPGERLSVDVWVSVPEDQAPGEYVAALRFAERPAASGSVGLAFEVPVALVVAGERVVAGEVVSIEATDVGIGIPLELRARLRNTGNTLLELQADISVKNTDGVEVGRSLLRHGRLSSGDERVLSYVISDIQPAGDYVIEASFRSGEVELGSLSTGVSVRQLVTGTPRLIDSSTITDSSGASPWRVSGIAIAVGIVSIGGAFVMARTRTRQQTGIGSRQRHHGARGRHSAEGDDPGWSGDRAEPATGSEIVRGTG